MRVIATVMGEDSIDNRNSEVSSMLDYAYSTYRMKKYISKNKVVKRINNLKTNIKKGDKVGVITVKNKGKVMNRVNLTVNRDIKKANIIELYFKYLKDVLSGNMEL